MAKKVTRTDVVYRVVMPGDVVVDCSTMEEALESTQLGGAYQGEIKVTREMDMTTWLANSKIREKKGE